MAKRKKIGIAVAIISTIVTLLFLEGGLRLYYFVKNQISPPISQKSDVLGWKNTPYHSFEVEGPTFGYVSYSTTKHGFREFGNKETNKTKVFVIGDSYTQAYCVSDEDTYYKYLEEHSDSLEIYAYGCGGYGTLQESMIIEMYIDSINPDIILWQFCTNDFINNSLELEAKSYLNNNHMTRPYFVSGDIEYRYPKQKQSLANIMLKNSYLLKMINIKLNIIQSKRYNSIEDTISIDHPLMVSARDVTKEIIQITKSKTKGIPIFAFSVNSGPPLPASDQPENLDYSWENMIKEVCAETGINYIDGVPQEVYKAKRQGVKVDGAPKDAHWTGEGHKIAGAYILSYLRSNIWPLENDTNLASRE